MINISHNILFLKNERAVVGPVNAYWAENITRDIRSPDRWSIGRGCPERLIVGITRGSGSCVGIESKNSVIVGVTHNKESCVGRDSENSLIIGSTEKQGAHIGYRSPGSFVIGSKSQNRWPASIGVECEESLIVGATRSSKSNVGDKSPDSIIIGSTFGKDAHIGESCARSLIMGTAHGAGAHVGKDSSDSIIIGSTHGSGSSAGIGCPHSLIIRSIEKKNSRGMDVPKTSVALETFKGEPFQASGAVGEIPPPVMGDIGCRARVLVGIQEQIRLIQILSELARDQDPDKRRKFFWDMVCTKVKPYTRLFYTIAKRKGKDELFLRKGNDRILIRKKGDKVHGYVFPAETYLNYAYLATAASVRIGPDEEGLLLDQVLKNLREILVLLKPYTKENFDLWI